MVIQIPKRQSEASGSRRSSPKTRHERPELRFTRQTAHFSRTLDSHEPHRRSIQTRNSTVSEQILPTVGALANGTALLCTQWHRIRYIGQPDSTANAEKDFAE